MNACDRHSARVGAVLLFPFIYSVFSFQCNFWQFTTFIIITFIIYNYTFFMWLCVCVRFFLSSHPRVASLHFDIRRCYKWRTVCVCVCWYWWRKRHWEKNMELNSKKKCGILCVNCIPVHFADKLTKDEQKWMKK